MVNDEYFGTAKPVFEPFDLDKAMKCMETHQQIKQVGTFKKALSYFTDQKAIERGSKRSQMQAQ